MSASRQHFGAALSAESLRLLWPQATQKWPSTAETGKMEVVKHAACSTNISRLEPIISARTSFKGSFGMTRLGRAIAAYQQKFDLENQVMAKEIGVAASTLSRIKAGTMPDARGMAKIMLWLSEDC